MCVWPVVFCVLLPLVSTSTTYCTPITYHQVCNFSALVNNKYGNRTAFGGTTYNGQISGMDKFFRVDWLATYGFYPPWQCGYAFIDWICSYDFKQCYFESAQPKSPLPCKFICEKAITECNSNGIQMNIGVPDCDSMPEWNASSANPTCTALDANFYDRYYDQEYFGWCRQPGNYSPPDSPTLWPFNASNAARICTPINNPVDAQTILGDAGIVALLLSAVTNNGFLPSENCSRYLAEFLCSTDYSTCTDFVAPRTPKGQVPVCRPVCENAQLACAGQVILSAISCSSLPATGCYAPGDNNGSLTEVPANIHSLFYGDTSSGANLSLTPGAAFARLSAGAFTKLLAGLEADGCSFECAQAYADVLCSAAFPGCTASGHALPVCQSVCESYAAACASCSSITTLVHGQTLAACPLSYFSAAPECTALLGNSVAWSSSSNSSDDVGTIGRDQWATYIIGAAFIIGVQLITTGLIFLYRWQGSAR